MASSRVVVSRGTLAKDGTLILSILDLRAKRVRVVRRVSRAASILSARTSISKRFCFFPRNFFIPRSARIVRTSERRECLLLAFGSLAAGRRRGITVSRKFYGSSVYVVWIIFEGKGRDLRIVLIKVSVALK